MTDTRPPRGHNGGPSLDDEDSPGPRYCKYCRHWSPLHGATPTGAERIAACWARDRNVPQDPYRPDWNRHKKAAPFKRNDAMLEAMPKGVIIFSGTGIQDNLADKARKVGIRLWDFRKRSG